MSPPPGLWVALFRLPILDWACQASLSDSTYKIRVINVKPNVWDRMAVAQWLDRLAHRTILGFKLWLSWGFHCECELLTQCPGLATLGLRNTWFCYLILVLYKPYIWPHTWTHPGKRITWWLTLTVGNFGECFTLDMEPHLLGTWLKSSTLGLFSSSLIASRTSLATKRRQLFNLILPYTDQCPGYVEICLRSWCFPECA